MSVLPRSSRCFCHLLRLASPLQLLLYFLALSGKNKVTFLALEMIHAEDADACLNASNLFSSDIFFQGTLGVIED